VKSQTKKKLSELQHVFDDFANGDEHEPIPVGGFEVELDEEVSEKNFLSGAAFLASSAAGAVAPAKPAFSMAKGFVNPMGAGGVKKAFLPPMMTGSGGAKLGGAGLMMGTAAASAGVPLKRVKRFTPAFDPNGEHAMVLNKEAWEADKEGVCPVVLDPSLYRNMRPHQKEGVQFLYRCVTESSPIRRGAILADDMGLGKSLQTIALLHTLLRQGPTGAPTVQKALIVAPSSLLENWKAEIRKWVGEASTVKPIILGLSTSKEQEKKQTILDFKFGRLYNIGIISYETLRKYAAELSGSIDVLVADEGHRIKSAAGNKTIDALVLASKGSRKVLLSGTPLQNNLSELFSMVDYVRPGALGTYASFQNVFAGPIEKSRDKKAKDELKELGSARLEELKNMLAPFMLRRSSAVNQAYLPELSSYAVFCRPSERQVSMMKSIVARRWQSDLYVGDEALVLLGELRKVCGHPALLEDVAEGDGSDSGAPSASGKMEATLSLLERIINGMGERVVVVSQWTSMLDVLEKEVNRLGFTTARLDGSTPVAKRQDVVDAFNKNNIGQVFLLSTQAGGVGLNLVGANRLVLYDSHWNPALDAQAMARIWRDGQTKQCYIYRMITAGSVEEKIYQRQMMKGQLARCCVGLAEVDGDGDGGMAQAGGKGQGKGKGKGKKEGGGSFTKEELKELFNIKVGVSCMTADQLRSSDRAFVDDAEADDSVLHAVRGDGETISFVFNERAQEQKQDQAEKAGTKAAETVAPAEEVNERAQEQKQDQAEKAGTKAAETVAPAEEAATSDDDLAVDDDF